MLNDKYLHKPTKPVKHVTPEIRRVLMKMWNIMVENHGVGIAANQIGRRERMAVIQPKWKEPPIFMINPKIIRTPAARGWSYEGCLSFPHEACLVKRYSWVIVEYMDEEGNRQEFKTDEMYSDVVQHEIDHLDGITIKDRRAEEHDANN